MKVSLTRIENILKNVGMDRTHIVMCKVYITDTKRWDEANAAYAEFVGEHKPARAINETSRRALLRSRLLLNCKIQLSV